MNAKILLFARYPRAGTVKTRLSPPIPPELAMRLYEAFLRDTIDKSLRLADLADTILFTADADDVSEFRGWLEDGGFEGVEVKAQAEGGLGVRLKEAVDDVGEGEVAVLLGTDHPTLPQEYIRNAINLAEKFDVVLIPARDGGYCLMATRRRESRLFHHLPYSTPELFDRLVARIEQSSMSLEILPGWYDVDEVDDLRILAADSHLSEAPRTREALQEVQEYL